MLETEHLLRIANTLANLVRELRGRMKLMRENESCTKVVKTNYIVTVLNCISKDLGTKVSCLLKFYCKKWQLFFFLILGKYQFLQYLDKMDPFLS